MSTYPDLEGKTVLITGATRGIGKVVAKELIDNQCKVLFTYRSQESCDQLKDFLGSNSEGVQLDLSDPETIKNNLEPFIKNHGLDALVNNAGMADDKLLMRVKAQDIQTMINTNLSSAMTITAVCSRFIMRGTNPSVVNMSSVIGLMGNTAQSVYAASKAGLIGFTKSVARELAGKNVRCNAICPGFIETEMTAAINEDRKKLYLEQIPMKRYGTPKNVADLVTFLLSERSAYITGEVIKIDGGLYT